MRRCGARATWALALAALVAAGAGLDAPPQPDPALEVVQAAASSYETPIVDAETNRGLRPTRLQAYGKTHYFQLAQDPVGTLVRWFSECLPGSCRQVPSAAPRQNCCPGLPHAQTAETLIVHMGCGLAACTWQGHVPQGLSQVCPFAPSGLVPRLRPPGKGFLPVRPNALLRVHW